MKEEGGGGTHLSLLHIPNFFSHLFSLSLPLPDYTRYADCSLCDFVLKEGYYSKLKVSKLGLFFILANTKKRPSLSNKDSPYLASTEVLVRLEAIKGL